jgi:hypothetical protein
MDRLGDWPGLAGAYSARFAAIETQTSRAGQAGPLATANAKQAVVAESCQSR